MLLELRWKTKRPLLFGTVILGFLSIFTKSQASSPFEALNWAWLSRCQRDVRLHFQKRQRRRSSYMVSTGYSHIPSSCEMKYQPAFKRLQGNPAFFIVRASQGPFHLRQKTESLSHTYFWGKDPLEELVESWPISSIESWECVLFLSWYGVHGAFLDFLCWNWCSSRLETGVSGNLWSCLK